MRKKLKLTQVYSLWKVRRKHFYNPSRNCKLCGGSVSAHVHYCPKCVDWMDFQGKAEKDYQDTLQAIREDWYMA